MAPSSGLPKSITSTQTYPRAYKFRGTFASLSTKSNEANSGVVLWIGKPFRAYLGWAETGVAEFSPFLGDAWIFPTALEATSALARALGPIADRFGVAVFPETLTTSEKPPNSAAIGASEPSAEQPVNRSDHSREISIDDFPWIVDDAGSGP